MLQFEQISIPLPTIKLFKRYVFQELNKFAKADYKGDAEVSVIQQIIQLGLDREELRDEIYVQIMRQVYISSINCGTPQCSPQRFLIISAQFVRHLI